MGLEIGEAFKDRCFLTVLATGLPATLLADVTCTVIDESGNRAALVVTEESDGWYTAPFTPDAQGTWATEWSETANPALYVFHYPYKEFLVGAGQEKDIHTDVADIHTDVGTAITDIAAVKAETALIVADTAELQTDWVDAGRLDAILDAIKAKTDNLPGDPADESSVTGYFDVPAQNAVVNAHVAEVVGNKTDDPAWFTSEEASLMRFAKAAASVGGGISYSGVCDAGMAPSLTTIVCDDLKGFGDDFFNTEYVMSVVLNDNSHGAAPETNFPKDITDYTSLSGTFVCAAFSANVEAGDKICVTRRVMQAVDAAPLITVPATNSLAYRLSQFLASGDGDWATGTALPSNISLYDILGGANGHPAFPAAAHPANGVTLAGAVHGIADRTQNHEVTKTFFGPCLIVATVDTTHTDIALGTVTLPNITGTITHVYAGFKFRMIENTNVAANKLNGAQEIQVDTVDAINFVDHQFGVAASTREGGDCIIGAVDLVATVDVFNHGYVFVWDEPLSELDNLVFNDIQPFLIVSYY